MSFSDKIQVTVTTITVIFTEKHCLLAFATSNPSFTNTTIFLVAIAHQHPSNSQYESRTQTASRGQNPFSYPQTKGDPKREEQLRAQKASEAMAAPTWTRTTPSTSYSQQARPSRNPFSYPQNNEDSKCDEPLRAQEASEAMAAPTLMQTTPSHSYSQQARPSRTPSSHPQSNKDSKCVEPLRVQQTSEMGLPTWMRIYRPPRYTVPPPYDPQQPITPPAPVDQGQRIVLFSAWAACGITPDTNYKFFDEWDEYRRNWKK
jgi:hypothetical protein